MKFSDFKVRDFYDYRIRSMFKIINNMEVEMFFATDLVTQYNHINKTNKHIYKFIENTKTIEMLVEYSKLNKIPEKDIDQNTKKYWNIPGIIENINFASETSNALFHGYIMCEELLHYLLIWLDSSFAVKVFTFLKQCRAADSQFLDHPDEFIKSRIVPAEESQDWSFMIIPCIRNSEIILKASYCRTKNITKTQFMNSNTIMLHGLPNGFSFKYFVFTELIQVAKSYGGHSNGCHRSSYSISRHVFENNFNIIVQDITHAINKTRLMLNWGLDYESEVCLQVLDKIKSLEIPFCTNINMSKDSLELIQKLFSSELMN